VAELVDVDVNQQIVVESPTLYDLDANGSIGAGDFSLPVGAWGKLGTSSDRKADGNNDDLSTRPIWLGCSERGVEADLMPWDPMPCR